MSDPEEAILIVDDTLNMLDVLAYELEEGGFSTRCASSFGEAMEIFGELKPRLVLSDVRMPNSGGDLLVHQIRQRHFCVPPMILMSAYSDIGTEEALDIGACDLIKKPFTPEDLMSTVSKRLKCAANAWSTTVEQAKMVIAGQWPSISCNPNSPESIRLGHGGFFLPNIHRNDWDYLKPGQYLQFELDVEELGLLELTGLIRWNSIELSSGGLGIEICDILDPSLRELLLQRVHESQPKAFIPKSWEGT